MGGNRKEKFVFYSAITGAIQGLERLSRVNYIDRTKLELCLLSQSTLRSFIRLLPTSEHNLWVREMTVAGLDLKNPVGIETFNCFKKVCIKERNTNESSRSDPTPKEAILTGIKKIDKSSQLQEVENSASDTEASSHTVKLSKNGESPKDLRESVSLGGNWRRIHHLRVWKLQVQPRIREGRDFP